MFQKGGKLKTESVKIMLKQGAKPYAVNVLYWEPSSSAQGER